MLMLILLVGIPAGSAQEGLPAEAGTETGNAEEQADDQESSGKETIVIRADRAWEEPEKEHVLHFQGNFELISPDWELRSDEADLFGPLDDPERIVARGSPAVVSILNEGERVIGEGETIVYERDTDILTLTTNARMTGDTVSMTSGEIVYDVGAERLKSSGGSGVEMILERDRR
jgi:lipopolysaccharide transport protein LptA